MVEETDNSEASVVEIAGDRARVRVSSEVYPAPAVLRALYWLTDRAFVVVDQLPSGSWEVWIRTKPDASQDLDALAGEFCNALVDQAVRDQVAAETRPIRELVFAKAFAASGALDDPVPGDDRDPVERQ